MFLIIGLDVLRKMTILFFHESHAHLTYHYVIFSYEVTLKIKGSLPGDLTEFRGRITCAYSSNQSEMVERAL